jgi:hypothetical protein
MKTSVNNVPSNRLASKFGFGSGDPTGGQPTNLNEAKS